MLRTLFEKHAGQLVPDIDRFVRENTQLQALRLKASHTPSSRKNFNDPVWKTVSLHSWEFEILDSRLLQRLRRIKQLGMADFVFTGAGYSRFEHCIGSVHTMELLVQAVKRSPDSEVTDSEHHLLRLAALLHDVGHCTYSHASEHLYGSFLVAHNTTLDEIRNVVEREYGCKPSPSELLSAAIVTSPHFAVLLDVVNAPVALSGSDAADWIGTLILGGYPDPSRPLLTQLLTGPFDADKLDYMSRDCRAAGIPLPVDIPRLIEKIRAVRVDVRRLSPHLQTRFKVSPDDQVTLLGVALSGTRAIEEMLIARVILFDKLYYHSKIRAAEAVLARAFSHLVADRPDLARPGRFLVLDDSQIALFGLDSLLHAAPRATPPGRRAARLLRRIRDRDLPKRAFCFGNSFRLPNGPAGAKGWAELIRQCSFRSHSTDIEDEIRRIARVLAANSTLNISIDPDDVFLTFPETSRVHTSMETYLVAEDRTVVPFRTWSNSEPSGESADNAIPFRHHFDVDRWADAYENNKAFGYVMAAHSARELVHVAAEIAFASRFNLRFGEGRFQFCKLDRGRLEVIKAMALKSGLLESLPDLRPVSALLSRSDNRVRVQVAARRLSGFEGERGLRITEDRVRSWVNQFPEHVHHIALRIAETIHLFGREDFVQSVKGQINSPRFRSYREAAWVPLGGPKDSASLWGYYLQDAALRDVEWRNQIAVRRLEEALRQPEQPIVFFDDSISSGGQAEAIFKTWFGQPTTLGEDHGTPLPEELQIILRDRPVALFFAVGLPDEGERILTKLKKLGLKAEALILAHKLPRDGLTAIGLSANELALGRRELRKIGFQLLRSTKPSKRWSDARCRECALGYGSSAQLVVFPMNVPTYSLTALWSNGTYNKRTWMPLVPRRPKA